MIIKVRFGWIRSIVSVDDELQLPNYFHSTARSNTSVAGRPTLGRGSIIVIINQIIRKVDITIVIQLLLLMVFLLKKLYTNTIVIGNYKMQE